MEVIVLDQKRFARILAVMAGASMLALAGPAAQADDEPTVNPSPEPSIVDDGGGTVDVCVTTTIVQPERTLKNGKVIPAKTRVTKECRQIERAQIREERALQREERALQREERAQLREEVREAGGSWGAVQRQGALIRVATKLAERHEQAPESAALGRILTLINYGLPEQLQFDIEVFLAQYELIFADLIKNGGDDEDSPEPSPSPSASPEPSPSASPEPSPSASPEDVVESI
jgi:hypothetical protein